MRLDHQLIPYTAQKLNMNKRLKYKSWHHKSSWGEYGQDNLRYPTQQYFHWYIPYSRGYKRKNKQMGSHQDKNLLVGIKNTSSKWKGNQTYGKTNLPMIPWTRVWSPKYTKNSHISTPGRQTIQLKNEQRTWTNTSPRKTHRGPRDTWKGVLSITSHQRDAN